MTQLMPVLVELVKAGKAIGLAYFAVLGLVPIISIGIKFGFIYASLKCICTTILSSIKYFYIVESPNVKGK